MSAPKILVVEDEEIVAFEIESALIDLNYEVVGVVASGEEAIEQTGEMGSDLVLMDIRLKGKMDGIEATEEIRRRYQLPVVYLTANADVATFQRAKISAPFGYVIKPFEDKALQGASHYAAGEAFGESICYFCHNLSPECFAPTTIFANLGCTRSTDNN